eukprot:scpid8599/ scgid3110/ Laminin subunit beta-3; Epiligrin subunit bata; Kalinin B1 chain; Kalinin subunit beta; Laminin B1k chain; Laminin-5 subunit beta; Nicein subunit beta
MLGNSTQYCKANGALTSVPECISENLLTGHRYCSGVIIRETSTGVKFKYLTAQLICKRQNARVITAKTAKCIQNVNAWVLRTNPNAPQVGLLGVMCELTCARQSNDHITSISESGIVTCDQGYEYIHPQPVCMGTQTIERCSNKSQATKVVPCPNLYRRGSDGISCVRCSCDAHGTESCDSDTGVCFCKNYVDGKQCDVCSDGSHTASTHLDSCTPCSCVANTTQAKNTCDMSSGICNCLDKYSGHRCQSCSLGHYQSGKDCIPCECSSKGANDNHCNVATGQCKCKPGYGGRQCSVCANGHFLPDTTLAKSPCVAFDSNLECQACYCSLKGSTSSSCTDGRGICQCKPGYTGEKCDSCISASQYHSTVGGCQELNWQLMPSSASLVQGNRVNLTHPFVFGSKFTSYDQVTTSFDGLISLNGFSGGYNLNSQVREERAIVAPYWTSRPGNKTCSNGTIEVHHVSETVDKTVFDVLKQLVLSSNTTQDFRPREAVVATWREIRESNQNNKRNTFQAAIISDECQSFAVFKYPEHGISWAGFPYPVMAASNILNTSGTPNVIPVSGVYNLTNGCSAELRARKHCLDNVRPAFSLGGSSVDMIECPSNINIASATTAFVRQEQITVHDCFLSGPTASRSMQEFASVCCYSKSDGQLIDTGLYQPFQRISANDSALRDICQTGGMLSHFFNNRNSPKAENERVSIKQSYCYGDPHLVSLSGESFDFHVVGEFVLAHMIGDEISMEVTARMQVIPVNNVANFTSITRVAITMTQGQSSRSLEIFSNSQGEIQKRGDHYGTVQTHLSRSIVASFGSFGANVSVQSNPILSVAIQTPENSQVIGLLNVDRDNGVDILQNITELRLEAKEYQVNESTSPFSYSSQESFRTYNPINPPTTGIVDTRRTVDGCDDDATCIADYILSSDINLAKSTLASKRDLNMSTNTVARTPPIISMNQTALHGTYQAASTVTVVASPRAGLTIMSINYTANGITVSAQRVSPSSLVLSWTPTERHLNGSVSLHVTAADSNGDVATMTIPIALCSCFGTCQPLASISLTEPFTQLGCASCEAGRTGSNCDEDLDSCITSPCSSSLHTCTDIPLPGDGFTCSCRAGFTESNGNCLDVNECVTGGGHSCPQGRSSCTNTAGSYLCQCSAGYTGDNCLDMDECSLDVNDCIRSRGSCINTAGSYECVCPEGFEGTGRQDYGGCDVVQCRTPKITNGKKNTSRILYGDTARYACDDGFRLLGDGSPNCTAEGKLTSLPKCVSFDGCAEGSHQCDQNAGCRKIAKGSSYVCTCEPGFTGDGLSCELVQDYCPEFDVLNAASTASSTTNSLGDNITLVCEDGYRLVLEGNQSDSYTCSMNDAGLGEWDGDAFCEGTGEAGSTSGSSLAISVSLSLLGIGGIAVAAAMIIHKRQISGKSAIPAGALQYISKRSMRGKKGEQPGASTGTGDVSNNPPFIPLQPRNSNSAGMETYLNLAESKEKQLLAGQKTGLYGNLNQPEQSTFDSSTGLLATDGDIYDELSAGQAQKKEQEEKAAGKPSRGDMPAKLIETGFASLEDLQSTYGNGESRSASQRNSVDVYGNGSSPRPSCGDFSAVIGDNLRPGGMLSNLKVSPHLPSPDGGSYDNLSKQTAAMKKSSPGKASTTMKASDKAGPDKDKLSSASRQSSGDMYGNGLLPKTSCSDEVHKNAGEILKLPPSLPSVNGSSYDNLSKMRTNAIGASGADLIEEDIYEAEAASGIYEIEEVKIEEPSSIYEADPVLLESAAATDTGMHLTKAEVKLPKLLSIGLDDGTDLEETYGNGESRAVSRENSIDVYGNGYSPRNSTGDISTDLIHQVAKSPVLGSILSSEASSAVLEAEESDDDSVYGNGDSPKASRHNSVKLSSAKVSPQAAGNGKQLAEADVQAAGVSLKKLQDESKQNGRGRQASSPLPARPPAQGGKLPMAMGQRPQMKEPAFKGANSKPQEPARKINAAPPLPCRALPKTNSQDEEDIYAELPDGNQPQEDLIPPSISSDEEGNGEDIYGCID